MRSRCVPVFYEKKSASTTQYDQLLQGIRAAAGRAGIQTLLIPEEEREDINPEPLPPVAIVTGTDLPALQRTISYLRASGRRAVLAGSDSGPFGSDVSCVTPSRPAETQQLVNYLYNCNRKRIALVGFGENSINDTVRLHAALNALASWGILLEKETICRWRQDPQESFTHFFQHAHLFDAVICPNDVIAICFLRQCAKHGLAVPEELYVASFGNMAIGRYFQPSITSMTMDMLCVGEQSFQAWRFLMNNDNATALKLTVPSRVLVRDSTAGQQAEIGKGTAPAAGRPDLFYDNPAIATLQRIESCLSQRDELDMRIIKGILQGDTYEQICEHQFISAGTLRYRRNKIFADAGVSRRQAFSSLMRTQLGAENPFSAIE